jgi:hypothetical protein
MRADGKIGVNRSIFALPACGDGSLRVLSQQLKQLFGDEALAGRQAAERHANCLFHVALATHLG